MSGVGLLAAKSIIRQDIWAVAALQGLSCDCSSPCSRAAALFNRAPRTYRLRCGRALASKEGQPLKIAK